jgi:uncharacterized integral membrane protein
MPWRLIGFIVLFAIFLAFMGFNLENSTTISFVFTQFDQVPVYMIAFASFIFGMICAIPLAISLRARRKEKAAKMKNNANAMIDTAKSETKKPNKKAKEPAADAKDPAVDID